MTNKIPKYIKVRSWNEGPPERVMLTQFGNGIHAVHQFGELDIKHLDRTGNVRHTFGRTGGRLHGGDPVTGLFPTLTHVKLAIAELAFARIS